MSIRMPKQRKDFTEQILNYMQTLFESDDARCHYCGKLINITTNQRGAYVILCPDCGALGTSSINPVPAYVTLREKGTIITRHEREAVQRVYNSNYIGEF